MFARFTPQAREAMVLAQEESARLRHPWRDRASAPGLLRQPGTAASNVLEGLGVTAATVERELIRCLGEPRGEQILGEEDERALRTVGIDMQEVRARVEETFGPGALERARPGSCCPSGGAAPRIRGRVAMDERRAIKALLRP